jgi:two-component system, sporulation sensor kinase C
MRVNGGRLLVRTREATELRSDSKGVFITIAEIGTGMSRETVTSIYNAFFTTKGSNGTGLGLWISGGIVQRHHGRLRVRSSHGEQRHGTVFELLLPYQAAFGKDLQNSHQYLIIPLRRFNSLVAILRHFGLGFPL